MHEDALAAGNLVVTIGEVRRDGIEHAVERALEHVAHCEAIVVDCDIDVIDRAQFPAAPGAGPGGMAVARFLCGVRRLAADPRVRVIDLTEWDPPLDPTDLSALTAARWVAECLAGSRYAGLGGGDPPAFVGQRSEGDREAQALRRARCCAPNPGALRRDSR